MKHHKLVTIRFSHYNERARWALDRFKVPYVEIPCIPPFYMGAAAFYSRGRGKSDRLSTKVSTPVLVTTEGERLCDSGDILRWVSDKFSDETTTLYPSDDVRAMDQHLHDDFGHHVRRVAYLEVLREGRLFESLAKKNVGAVQATLFVALSGLMRKAIVKGVGVTPEKAERGLKRIREEYETVSQRLSDGRKYLFGDRFTAADLSFGALSAPVLAVSPQEGYGARLPVLGECPGLDAIARELRATPAGKFALRLFAEERGERQIPCLPALS